MKNFLLGSIASICALSSTFADDYIVSADQITYDWLVTRGEQGGETDHIAHFHKLFQEHKVKWLLEFGMGNWTKYFLDSCNRVISVDFITHGYGPEVYKKFVNLYRDYSNWTPIAYFSSYFGDPSFAPYRHLGSDSVYRAASYQSPIRVMHRSMIFIWWN
jgi:hypothetical protein